MAERQITQYTTTAASVPIAPDGSLGWPGYPNNPPVWASKPQPTPGLELAESAAAQGHFYQAAMYAFELVITACDDGDYDLACRLALNAVRYWRAHTATAEND